MRIGSFATDDSGNVALMFAAALIVLIGIAGLATDYAVGVHRKRSLDTALDASILAGTQAAVDARSKGKANWEAVGLAAASAMFSANLPDGSDYQNLSFTPTFAVKGAEMIGTARYSARSLTSFMQVFGKDEIPLAGTATATLTAENFIDINFVIDVSGSMGIGAEESDMAKMYAATSCEFACHQTPSWANVLHKFTPSKANLAGATLRIDVIRNAIKKLLAKIRKQVRTANSVRVSIHTVSRRLGTLQALSSDLTAVEAKADTITMADNNDGATFLSFALETLANTLPRGGDGSAANKPLSFVVLLSDGIDDSLDNQLITSGSKKNFYEGVWATGMDWRNTSPRSAPAGDGVMQAFSPSACGTLKAKDNRILGIQIKYVSPKQALADPYFKSKIDYVTKTLATPLANAFKACVTKAATDYAMASKTSEIELVLNRIFDDVVFPDIVHLSR